MRKEYVLDEREKIFNNIADLKKNPRGIASKT